MNTQIYESTVMLTVTKIHKFKGPSVFGGLHPLGPQSAFSTVFLPVRQTIDHAFMNVYFYNFQYIFAHLYIYTFMFICFYKYLYTTTIYEYAAFGVNLSIYL